MRRALSDNFLRELNPKEGGKYGNLVKRVQLDKDLDLEFRGSYMNVYYHGHSILLLRQTGTIEIHRAFTTEGLHPLPERITSVDKYMELLPLLKDNVSCHVKEDQQGRKTSKSNRELEFEQLLIRANNREITCNSNYIILDRQYRLPNGRRIDLVALRYASGGKPKGNLSVIEVKYAQNPDIQDIRNQVQAYGNYLQDCLEDISQDMERVLRQKLALGLISRSPDRLKWFARDTFAINRDIESAEILVYLIDYNPGSELIARSERPSFPGKVRYACGGLALWQSYFVDFPQK